jgi:FKBP-type peptidyl-prolyl cis-trans isomerase
MLATLTKTARTTVTCPVAARLSSTAATMAANLTADGGVKKQVLVEGRGTERPPPGAHVTAHYTGRFPATQQVFDSSHKRGRPFQFQIGVGQVIKGVSVLCGCVR